MLFGDEDAGILSEDSVLLGSKSTDTRRTVASKSKNSQCKNFASDLESFLEQAFEESFEEQMSADAKKTAPDTPLRRRSHSAIGGLDNLIRSTVQPSTIDIQELPTRRITLVFDQQKLEKLKQIARVERAYLKDIIDNIVEDYILAYEYNKNNKTKS
jgi:hypothetical protein